MGLLAVWSLPSRHTLAGGALFGPDRHARHFVCYCLCGLFSVYYLGLEQIELDFLFKAPKL